MQFPTIQQRLALRSNPAAGRHVMLQKWRDLLFLHWEIDPHVIQSTLPEGLFVDSFKSKAYVGVVPFWMVDIRPRFCPPIPPVSNFLEMNVRTYVHDARGTPGVWFYSLDANQHLAVKLARAGFKLPYFFAKMEAEKLPATGEIRFRCERDSGEVGFTSEFLYRPMGETFSSVPGGLEFFLIERYLLYAYGNGRLFSGRVFHKPYVLQKVEARKWDSNALRQNGFDVGDSPPDHAVCSKGVSVKVFALQKNSALKYPPSRHTPSLRA